MEPDLDLQFRAIADRTRRTIIETLLVEGELPAGRIVKKFSSAQPTISKHLKVLEDAGLVRRRADGRHQYFSLRAESLEPATGWLVRHTRLWNASLDRLGRYLDDVS